VQGLGVSIARGTGRQTLGAAIVFVSYYIVALPIGVPLMFATYLGLAGNAFICRQFLSLIKTSFHCNCAVEKSSSVACTTRSAWRQT